MSAPEKYQYEIEEIRARLPMLDVVAKAGLEVRRMGRLSKVACPFHGERTASFVVYEDHGHCYGCGWHGSIFDFWMGVKGVDFKRAVEDLAGMAGVRAVTMAEAERWRASVVARPVERERERPELPELRKLSAGECRVLAEGRGVSAWAVQEAGERGLLWGAEFQGQAAWCLTDRARRNAQLRRLDGNRWYGNVKAWTVAGSWASWPVGCVELGGARKIAVVEGGPDALAILDVIRGWGWRRQERAEALRAASAENETKRNR